MNGIFGAVNRVFAAHSKIQTMLSQRLARTTQKGPFPKIKKSPSTDHFWNIAPNPRSKIEHSPRRMAPNVFLRALCELCGEIPSDSKRKGDARPEHPTEHPPGVM